MTICMHIYIHVSLSSSLRPGQSGKDIFLSPSSSLSLSFSPSPIPTPSGILFRLSLKGLAQPTPFRTQTERVPGIDLPNPVLFGLSLKRVSVRALPATSPPGTLFSLSLQRIPGLAPPSQTPPRIRWPSPIRRNATRGPFQT